MDGQDEWSDPRTYDSRFVSSNGQLEKLELNFLSKPPPNSATLMMDCRDERPGTTTYDDRSVSSQGQLEEKELTFSLPNSRPNSATFLMNDQDEMPDPRTYDDLKTWSFIGNEMDISDREDSEERFYLTSLQANRRTWTFMAPVSGQELQIVVLVVLFPCRQLGTSSLNHHYFQHTHLYQERTGHLMGGQEGAKYEVNFRP